MGNYMVAGYLKARMNPNKWIIRTLSTVLCFCGLSSRGWGQTNDPGMALDFSAAAKSQVVFQPFFDGTGSITLEAWIFPRAYGGTIVSRGHGGDGNITDYILQVNAGANGCVLSFYAGAGWHSSVANFPLNTWTHVAATFDLNNQKRLYINGVLDSTYAAAAPLYNSGSAIYVGRQGSVCDCNFFEGIIDEVRVWDDRVLTEQEIRNYVHRSRKGFGVGEVELFIYCRFDEGTGTTTTDLARGFTGTLVNGPAWVVSTAPLGTPQVNTLAATAAAGGSATLNGSVNPRGQDGSAWFEYGTTTNYGSRSANISLLPTNSFVPVSTPLTGLTPATTYHFRLVATNAAGTNRATDLSFTTSPFLDTMSLGGGMESVSWADYNNDGFLDVLLTGNGSTALYRNTGNGAFVVQTNTGLPNWYTTATAWLDVDGDGWLDLAFGGALQPNEPTSGVYEGGIYRNNHNDTFSRISTLSSGRVYRSIDVGDYDNDGRPDLLLVWNESFDRRSMIIQWCRNLGGGAFTPAEQLLPYSNPASGYPAPSLGDYDRDGRLDAVVGVIDSVFLIWLVHNDGNGNFTRSSNPLFTSVRDGLLADLDNDAFLDVQGGGSFAWNLLPAQNSFLKSSSIPGPATGRISIGDFDNDGRLDTALVSAAGSGIYRNNGNRTFSDSGFYVPPMGSGNVTLPNASRPLLWGDYDNDGRLDYLLGSQIYHSVISAQNTLPSAPTGLIATVSGQSVILSWDPGSDAQTPANGLTYNVRVGTTPGGSEITPTSSNPQTGFNRLAQMGATGPRRFVTINGLAPGTYYWSVQSVDSALAGSPFASEQSFTVLSPPIVTTLLPSLVGRTSAQLNGLANPGGRITSAWFEFGPTTNYGTPTASQAIGSGFAAVPVSDTISGLTPDTEYHFHVSAMNVLGQVAGADITFKTLYFDVSPASVAMVLSPNGSGNATVSLTNPAGTALTISNSFAAPTPTFVGVFPANTNLPANGGITFSLLFDATGLSNGVYQTTLFINSGGERAVAAIPVQLLVSEPVRIANFVRLGEGSFQIQVNGGAGSSYTVLTSTNITQPASAWTVLGTATQVAPGILQFADPINTNAPAAFYRLRSP